MDFKQIITEAIIENLKEAVSVDHSRYVRSHGKKAKDPGYAGDWHFTHKEFGDAKIGSDDVHAVHGRFTDAKKSAQKWAKEKGHHRVYVME